MIDLLFLVVIASIVQNDNELSCYDDIDWIVKHVLLTIRQILLAVDDRTPTTTEASQQEQPPANSTTQLPVSGELSFRLYTVNHKNVTFYFWVFLADL